MNVKAFDFLNCHQQDGYLCIFKPSDISLMMDNKSEDLLAIQSRMIPDLFQHNKLNQANFSYRIKSKKFNLTFDLKKLKEAKVLPAKVKSMDIKSVVSLNGNILSHVQIKLSTGNKKYLSMKLPKSSHLMSVFIRDKAVQAVNENNLMLIPIPQSLGKQSTILIDIFYSTQGTGNLTAKHNYVGPSFDLPLENINWYLYLPNFMHFKNFSGNMDYVNHEPVYYWQDTAKYLDESQLTEKESILQARQLSWLFGANYRFFW